MPRSLTVFLPIRGCDAAAAFASDPACWLPLPAGGSPSEGWVVTLHAGPISHSVVCNVGAPSRAAAGVWRPFSWQPAGRSRQARQIDRLLPRFSGDIGLIHEPDPTLVLAGSYEPPGAAVGAAADRVGLERVAHATGRRLLSDIARRLSEMTCDVEPQNGSLPLRR